MHFLILALFTALDNEILVGDTGDIATVDIALKGSGADCPFPFSAEIANNSVRGFPVLDAGRNLIGIGMVIAKFQFSAFCTGLIDSVIVCDSSGISGKIFPCFTVQAGIQTTLYLTVDGGDRAVKAFCYGTI